MHLAPVKTSVMKFFCKIINTTYSLIIFVKSFILNAWQGYEHASNFSETRNGYLVLFRKVAILKNSELPWSISTEVFFSFIIRQPYLGFLGFYRKFSGQLSNISYVTNCAKSVQIRSYFWSVFSCIRTEYGNLLRKSPYSVRMQGNTDQKKLRIWTLFTQWQFLWLIIFANALHHSCLTRSNYASATFL